MKKSRINRIPLNERLNNINKGYAGDEAYNTEAIIRFADIPIMEYLGAFHVECGGMLRSLHIKKADAQHMTYQVNNPGSVSPLSGNRGSSAIIRF